MTDVRLAYTTPRIGSVTVMELSMYDMKFIPTCHISKPEHREIGRKKPRKGARGFRDESQYPPVCMKIMEHKPENLWL